MTAFMAGLCSAIVNIISQVNGVNKVPYNLIFFPIPIFFLNLFSFQKMLSPSALFSSWYYLFSPSPLHNLIFFLNRLDKLPPPPNWGKKALYTSLKHDNKCVHIWLRYWGSVPLTLKNCEWTVWNCFSLWIVFFFIAATHFVCVILKFRNKGRVSETISYVL